MVRLAMCIVFVVGVVNAGIGQEAPANTATASCSFQDGKQLSLRYHQEAISGKSGPPEGKVWTPAGMPMFLFTQSELLMGNSQIPVGAYSMYVIPRKDNWILILNRNVSEGSKYDEHQDLSRAEMQIGQLSEPNKQFSVFFGHVAPKQCNIRMYYGKTGTWVEFKEK